MDHFCLKNISSKICKSTSTDIVYIESKRTNLRLSFMSENKEIIKYKVRDIATGLYQGTKFDKWSGEIEWTKNGKMWSTLDGLKFHLKSLEENRIQLSPFWEIIEILNRKEVSRYPATVFSKKKKTLI